MMQSAIDVNGNWPKLANQRVDAIVLQEFWYQGTLEDEAMVCWICVGLQWYRIYFDMGSAYCIESDFSPRVELADDDLCDCQFNDITHLIGLKSTQVRQARLEEYSHSIGFVMEFTNGVCFQLNYTRLKTEYSLNVSH
jgi:hypothetical protein